MTIIEENIIEATLREVAGFNEIQSQQQMKKLGARQSDLLAFITTSVEDMRPDAAEVCVYVFFIIYRIFEKSSTAKLKRISAKKIISAYEKNEQMLLKLDGAHDKFFERSGEIKVSNQPNVMRYALEALMEDDEADSVNLTEDEIGSIFLILMTAIDVLDKMLSKATRNN